MLNNDNAKKKNEIFSPYTSVFKVNRHINKAKGNSLIDFN